MFEIIIAILLTLILIVLVNTYRQQQEQHKELIKFIDSLAEMIGEAIDKIERG